MDDVCRVPGFYTSSSENQTCGTGLGTASALDCILLPSRLQISSLMFLPWTLHKHPFGSDTSWCWKTFPGKFQHGGNGRM